MEIITNDQGGRTTRSLVAFTETEMLIGTAAENQWMKNTTGTIYGAKRLIGRRFDDEFVQNHIKYCSFEVGRGTDGRPTITVHQQGQRREFYAEDISSMILGYMRTIAINFTGKDITNAVITVPAYFNNSQREATKNAGRLAGLNVMRIINEPIAAAISYGFHADDTVKEKTVLIFDLGGGTFDVSLVRIRGHNFTVMATAGDPYLGGEDFNNNMVGYLCEEFERKNGIGIRNNPKSIRRMREAVERAKRILSTAVETTIELEYLHVNIPLFHSRITRAKFEEINADLFLKCIHIVEQCIRDASINKRDINSVVLVGGSSRIPRIGQLLLEHFKQINLSRSENPDESVAIGATLLATKLVGDGGDTLRNLQFVDITTLSLGVEHAAGVMSVFIPRNTEIPARKEIVFTTGVDNQDSVYVGVYEGERTMASENNFLGGFNLRGIPRAPAGVPQIYVCFEIDMDGVLTVSARSGANGPRMEIVITNEKRAAGTEASDRRVLMDGEDEEQRRRLLAKGALRDHIRNLRSRLATENRANYDVTGIRNLEESINRVATWLDENPSAEAREYNARMTELQSMCRRAFARGWFHIRR